MKFYKKSIVGILAVALIVGVGLGISGVNFSGDIFGGGKVPWWCVRNAEYIPGVAVSGESQPRTPSGGGVGNPRIPGGFAWNNQNPALRSGGVFRKPDVVSNVTGPIRSSIKSDFKKLDPPYTSEIVGGGSGSRSGGNGDGILNKSGSRGGVGGISIPGIPGVNPPSGEQPASSEPKKDPGFWYYQLKCPDGYGINYGLVNNDCVRIKTWLDSGKFTEKTLPPEWKAKLPGCKRAGSWFLQPKMSQDDCDKFYMDMWANNFKVFDQTKYAYCYNMYPGQEQKDYKSLQDQCLNYKKNGGPVDPKVKAACEKQMWWWNSNVSKKDCEKIFGTISSFKSLGGNMCELEMGPKTDYCTKAYPELDKDNAGQCMMGGGGDY